VKGLVDESLPVGLAAELSGDISTVRAQRWLGLRNGVLLRAAADAGFDVLITADRALRHQQNLDRIGIGVVLIVRVRNRMRDLRPLVPRINTAAAQVRKVSSSKLPATLCLRVDTDDTYTEIRGSLTASILRSMSMRLMSSAETGRLK
jgi:hypothetical protein